MIVVLSDGLARPVTKHVPWHKIFEVSTKGALMCCHGNKRYSDRDEPSVSSLYSNSPGAIVGMGN